MGCVYGGCAEFINLNSYLFLPESNPSPGAAPVAKHQFDVIYMDDDPMMTELFNQFVSWKYQQWRSYSFTDPLTLYKQINQDEVSAKVWIIDLMMPEKNGTEIAAAIREKYGMDAVIIGYTALETHVLQVDPQYSGGLRNFSEIVKKNEGISRLLGLADSLIRSQPVV
jgi:CheY-like chemotaxis protein